MGYTLFSALFGSNGLRRVSLLEPFQKINAQPHSRNRNYAFGATRCKEILSHAAKLFKGDFAQKSGLHGYFAYPAAAGKNEAVWNGAEWERL